MNQSDFYLGLTLCCILCFVVLAERFQASNEALWSTLSRKAGWLSCRKNIGINQRQLNLWLTFLFLFQPLPVPDISVADSVHSLAMSCIWVHLAKKVTLKIISDNSSAVASMRPTEALASVKFWRISPIIFILHKRSSEPLRKDCLSWPFGLATALNSTQYYPFVRHNSVKTEVQVWFESLTDFLDMQAVSKSWILVYQWSSSSQSHFLLLHSL